MRCRAVDAQEGLKRRRRATLLWVLGLDPALARWVAARPVRCECGTAAVALGVFWSGRRRERYRNAMLLCAACAAAVDCGVTVVWIGGRNNGEQTRVLD